MSEQQTIEILEKQIRALRELVEIQEAIISKLKECQKLPDLYIPNPAITPTTNSDLKVNLKANQSSDPYWTTLKYF